MSKKDLTGKIKSTKMQRTVVVVVNSIKMHPLYKKSVKRGKKYMAHLPENMKVSEGDSVRIEPCRPVSKHKKWVVKEVI